jgi:hypothetical protein
MSEPSQTYTEKKSQQELDSTEVGPLTARVLTWAFVALIAGVPVIQVGSELRRGETPQALAVFEPLKRAVRSLVAGKGDEALRRVEPLFTRAFLHGYESGLEDHSIAKGFFQPRVQDLLTGWLGFGNDKGVVGRGKWLFYQPGLDYLVGPDFTDSGQILVRAKRMVDKQHLADPHPDPRPAILKLHRELAQLGIHLVVAPIPDKAMIQPARLTRRMERAGPTPVPNNRGFPAFAHELRAEGVDLVDLSPQFDRAGDVRYLAQDTHWTPAFMAETARMLAAHIRDTVDLPGVAPPLDLELRPLRVSAVGDLVAMLRLTPGQQIYAPQEVLVQQVVTRLTGKPWQAERTADVLLLGDSFTNIYSNPSLGWGHGAGLAEHLSYELRRPIDVLALNGGGASGTRQALASTDNRDRLKGKRVVVFQFSIRDLACDDWAPVSLSLLAPTVRAVAKHRTSEPTSPAPVAVVAAPSSSLPVPSRGPAEPVPLTVVGRVLRTSQVPEPYTAPYDACVAFTEIEVEKVVSGTYPEKQLLAVFWAMKDNKWLPAARYAPGDRLRLRLVPMKNASEAVRSAQRADDTDDYTHLPYFVVSEETL